MEVDLQYRPLSFIAPLALLAILVQGCAGSTTQQSKQQQMVQYGVPQWMVLKKGAHAMIPEAPWPNGAFTTGLPAVVTSEAEWQKYYRNPDHYIPQSPPGAHLGDKVTVSSQIVRDQSYGADGAFLDGFVEVKGPNWHGVTMVTQLVPLIPTGTDAIVVPDGQSQAAFVNAESKTSTSSFQRYDRVRIERVTISAVHPDDEKSVRVLVRSTSGNAEGWVDLDALAIPGIRPDPQNDTSVNDGCDCDFIRMIPDFVATRFHWK